MNIQNSHYLTIMKSKYAIRFGKSQFKASPILSSVFATLCLGSGAMAASPPGDVVGKVTVGYQGWFACVGDGAPINSWWHYSGTFAPPTPTSLSNSIHCWPDMRQFSAGVSNGILKFQ